MSEVSIFIKMRKIEHVIYSKFNKSRNEAWELGVCIDIPLGHPLHWFTVEYQLSTLFGWYFFLDTIHTPLLRGRAEPYQEASIISII